MDGEEEEEEEGKNYSDASPSVPGKASLEMEKERIFRGVGGVAYPQEIKSQSPHHHPPTRLLW